MTKKSKLPVVSLDADTESADWTKTNWDLPPYMSKEFLELNLDLDHFKQGATYKAAVASGLIHDDEWVGSLVETPPAPDNKLMPRTRSIHIHLRRS